MQRVLVINKLGEEDLIEIYRYISKYNIKAAIRIKQTILRKCKLLLEFPEMGNKLSNRFDVRLDLMYTICLKYFILYRYTDEQVIIHRIFDSRTEFINKLF